MYAMLIKPNQVLRDKALAVSGKPTVIFFIQTEQDDSSSDNENLALLS